MESPVVVDKPPEYGNNERGFPFDEEEGTGVWSELEARHPDIAARLRQRPTTWERKRRPSSRDADDFGDSFGGFNRFPFGDIPSEFREHFPSHWNRRYSSRDESQPQPQSPPQSPPQQTTSTQTEHPPTESPTLTQYGLRNTVDLGQKSAVDPSVDADDRNHRSMSAPPDSRTPIPKMSGQNHHDPPPQHSEQQSNVRIIPIKVEGRDSPVINKSVDHGTHYGEPKPSFEPTHSYFDDNPPYYNAPQNFGKSCGAPSFYKAGPQPFVQQKMYPQNAGVFTRGASPHRSQSPRSTHEEYVKVPVHHEQSAPKPEPHRPQQTAPQPQPPKPQQQPQPPQQPTQQPPPNPPTPPQEPKAESSANDPINQILAVQTEVLNLMNEVENFTGTKKDKRYIYLDEMLTRNLIKLDNIETDGKEIIRTARKKAVKCIEKCIAVLEVKAEKGSAAAREAEMNAEEKPQDNTVENGEVEVNKSKETNDEPQQESTEKGEPKLEEQKENMETPPLENQETQPQAPDTRPEQPASVNTENQDLKEEPKKDDSQEIPATGDKVDVNKNGAKNVKRDKSKEKPAKDSKDKESLEPMQVDDKGDKPDSQGMDVDGAASQ